MKFEIRRTSECWNNKPCPESVKEDCIRVDRRATDDPMKNQHIGQQWYERGINHRVEDERICRDFPEHRYIIEFNTLEELISFMKEHGNIVINNSSAPRKPNLKVIEIYDSSREL